MNSESNYKDYGYQNANAGHMHERLWSGICRLVKFSPGMRVLDLGCGNGSFAERFLQKGCHVVGVDLSETGIAIARETHPHGRFEVLPVDDQVLTRLGEEPFDVVVSTEVVEHLYDPRSYARGCFAAVRPGGQFVCSTPYHGYLKNLAISLANKWDRHLDPLWDGGHIKFWSPRTLRKLLGEAGFEKFQVAGVGRAPWFWMSMVMAAVRPFRR